MTFIRPQNKTFKRKVWYFKLSNFERYREILADYNLEEKVNLSTDIVENINHITETIMSAAEQAIPNKVNVIPTHKKDDKSLQSNYRPITLLSQIGKTLE